MRLRIAPILVLPFFFACGPAEKPAPTLPTPPATQPASQPAAIGPVVDEGKFILAIGKEPIGSETFTVREGNGRRELTTHSEVAVSGATTVVDGKLTTDAAGKPISGEFAQGDVKLSLARKNGVLTLSRSGSAGGGEMAERAPSDLFMLQRTVAHMGLLCSLAGDAPKELKIFPDVALVLAARQEIRAVHQQKLQPVSLVVATLGGKDRIDVVCDGSKPLVIGGGGGLATREGWEDLRDSLVAAQYEKPKLPDDLQEEEIKVKAAGHADLGDGDADLACSVITPKKKKGKLPAIAFISAYGPYDRDGDTAAPDVRKSLFKILAIAAGEAGIASIRCDNRGIAASTGNPRAATLRTTVDDTAAMVETLRQRADVDGGRIGVIGLEDGAAAVQLLAAKDPKLKALVLLDATARPFAEVTIAQLESAARARGAKEEQIAQLRAHDTEIFAAIQAGQPLPASVSEGERAALEPVVPRLRELLGFDPPANARKLGKVAVLILRAGKDPLTTAKDVELLTEALKKAGNKRVTTKTYPALDQMFAVSKTGTPADLGDPDLPVDLDFVKDVQVFLKKNL